MSHLKIKITTILYGLETFLNAEDHGLPYTVVHGHTIVDEVEIHPRRINIDTGAL